MSELSGQISTESDDTIPENTNAIMMEELTSVREHAGGSKAAPKDE